MNKDHHLEFLQEIRQEITALEGQIAALRQVERWHASKVEETKPPAPHAPDPVEPPVRQPGVDEYRDLTMKDALTALFCLFPKGTAKKTPEITRLLLGGGYQTKKPAGLINSVFALLSKTPDLFEKPGVGLWKLRDDVYDNLKSRQEEEEKHTAPQGG